MFTGIVEEVGKISKIAKKSGFWQVGVICKKVHPKVKPGSSVAVNGVCLTVVKKQGSILSFDAVEATLKKSNLKRLRIGDQVNLESSLSAGDTIEGHFVLGHADGEVKIKKLLRKSGTIALELEAPVSARKYIVERGSVALEGMSLTIASVNRNSFSVNIIPYTWENTNLRYKKAGSYLNVEWDYLGKLALNK